MKTRRFTLILAVLALSSLSGCANLREKLSETEKTAVQAGKTASAIAETARTIKKEAIRTTK